ncbi:hypothetical protein D187_005704 [Cystobacter fuscus DSM 2262]|uniref:Uncharacterized protein n=1 Tax=Cystobacter fuscus (strain ATCC 25194 / DSM 2262 / NBRC 100088 / M29) TaxID=1242864 RepID=S9R327_CYSF2|nr:hypothetical protein D187_005704 [Cystobacter fuscus DSM 2262]
MESNHSPFGDTRACGASPAGQLPQGRGARFFLTDDFRSSGVSAPKGRRPGR